MSSSNGSMPSDVGSLALDNQGITVIKGFFKGILPHNTAVSEYRRVFATPKNGGIGRDDCIYWGPRANLEKVPKIDFNRSWKLECHFGVLTRR